MHIGGTFALVNRCGNPDIEGTGRLAGSVL